MTEEKIHLLIKIIKESEEKSPFYDEYLFLAKSALEGDLQAIKRLDDEEENVLGEVFTDLDFGCMWT